MKTKDCSPKINSTGLREDTVAKQIKPLQYNPKTGKYVQRLRLSTKGKAKGKVYQQKWLLAGSPQHQGYLPIGLPPDWEAILKAKAGELYPGWQIDPELLLVFSYCYFKRLILANRAYKEQKRNKKSWNFRHRLNQRYFVSIQSGELQRWLGKHYAKFCHVLRELDWMEHYEQSKYCVGAYTLQYRFNPMLFNIKEKLFYKKVAITNPRILLKFSAVKAHNQKLRDTAQQISGTHLELANLLPFAQFNQEVFDYIQNQSAIINKQYAEFLVTEINSGMLFYKQDQDVYGERFHSVYSRMWGELLPFLEINGQPTKYQDNANSQFYFFSILTYPVVRELLPEFEAELNYLSRYANAPEWITFCNWCQAGLLYWQVGALLGIDKDLAKGRCFELLFSETSKYRHRKKFLATKLPLLVHLADHLNHARERLPEMLQKMESRLMIGKFFRALLDHECKFITVHDSVIYPVQDEPLVKAIFRDTFQSLGLPVPAIKPD